MLAVSVIIFGLARITGDPLDVLLPEDATPEDFEAAAEVWGLDKPLHVQYLVYLGNIATGNLGESIKWPGKNSAELIASRLPATFQLAAVSLLVAAVIGVPLGVITAVRRDTVVDYQGKVFAMLGQAIPNFWLGIILMWIFGVLLGWLPTSGKGGISHLILPAFTLGYSSSAALMRLTRSSMLEVLDSEYIKLARIKGLSERKVIWKHCLRNAAIAPVTYFGLILGGFMTGSVVTESVFAWPGVGLLAIDALRSWDFQVVQSVVLLFAGVFIATNLLVDVLYAYLDPRIRYT
jgi:peptide/nickel transport system permease protein